MLISKISTTFAAVVLLSSKSEFDNVVVIALLSNSISPSDNPCKLVLLLSIVPTTAPPALNTIVLLVLCAYTPSCLSVEYIPPKLIPPVE